MTHHYFRNDGTTLQAAELHARAYARESVPGSSLGTLGRHHAQALIAALDEARRERNEARGQLAALRLAAREVLVAFEVGGTKLEAACRGLLGALVADTAPTAEAYRRRVRAEVWAEAADLAEEQRASAVLDGAYLVAAAVNTLGRRFRARATSEVDYRASLPVLPTCGDCGWCSVPRRDGPRHCENAKAPAPPPVVDATAPPPPTCPLRGTP